MMNPKKFKALISILNRFRDICDLRRLYPNFETLFPIIYENFRWKFILRDTK